jgi:aminoglycoside phosphotransferase family enzyme
MSRPFPSPAEQANAVTCATSGLERKVAFLRRPEAYPETTATVETRETHMAWVFLTDRFAYKLKKPVRYAYLDYSTLAARERMCREELRLNRRLAPDIYLGVVPLARTEQGDLELEGGGPVADWLVKMRRLPAAGFLDRAIADGRADEASLRDVAGHLARFYRRARPMPMSPDSYRARILADIEENHAELLAAGDHVNAGQVRRLSEAQRAFVARRGRVLDDRARQGRIVEAHGDLRPEHVHLGPPPAIIDALEFKPEFRQLDPVDELGYLGMECERLGAPSIGANLRLVYRQELDDPFPVPLLYFYKAYRACLRAKIALWHLNEPDVAEPEKWPRRAHAYLELAERYVPRFAGD